MDQAPLNQPYFLFIFQWFVQTVFQLPPFYWGGHFITIPLPTHEANNILLTGTPRMNQSSLSANDVATSQEFEIHFVNKDISITIFVIGNPNCFPVISLIFSITAVSMVTLIQIWKISSWWVKIYLDIKICKLLHKISFLDYLWCSINT